MREKFHMFQRSSYDAAGMSAPGQPPLPALTQWLIDNRRPVMKLGELARKLTDAGYRNRDGFPVTETTLRGWEARSGGVPQSAVPYLERIFEKRAPSEWEVADQSAVVAAIRENTAMLSDVLTELRSLSVSRDETIREQIALLVRLTGLTTTLAERQDELAARPRAADQRRSRPASTGTK